MKRSFFKLSLQLLLIIVFPFAAISQDLDWNLNISKPFTFTSVNPVDDPGVTMQQMWYVSMKDLMELPNSANDLYGIRGKLNDPVKGFVKVSVYLYDQNPPPPDDEKPQTGRGPLIFQCFMDKAADPAFIADSSYEYDFGNWLAWWPDAKDKEGGFYFNDYWKSNDARTAAMAAAFYNYNGKFNGWNAAGTSGTAVIPYSLPDLQLPVIIEVTIYKANVSYVRLPGIGFVEPGYFKPPYLDIKAATTQIYNNSAHLNIAIASPESNDKITFSDIKINLSPFEDMSSPPLATQTITVSQIPYANKDLQLNIGKDPMPGEFWIWASYDITIEDHNGITHKYPNRQQFLANYNVSNGSVQFPYVYTVTKHDYNGLPVFTLNGGMSAEYGVEKSVASLSSGISETWDARLVDGKPDLKGGGPVSIYPNPNKYDFLDQAVKQTVKVYNDNLGGATTPINTVIIGTGIAHVPYLSNAMKAPFLPLHFLVSTHSVAEIQRILDTAITDGYSPFSMIGYDPSIKDIGVAWIKLRELPPAYKQFLIDHNVQNVIIMGYNQGVAGGEPNARRIWIEGQSDDDFAEGSMYMMGHGEESTYKELYKDYYRLNLLPEKNLVDWEGGITDMQIQSMSSVLKNQGITAYTIQSGDSFDFYRWAVDVQLKIMEKNKQTPQKISMNEYLIGFPEYELYTNTVPYLYWQGGFPGPTAFHTYDFTEFKMSGVYPGTFKDIPVYIQAKFDRSKILDSLKNYFNNVTMGSWQQADIWDPSDGMNSPCELIATAITKDANGAEVFADWNNKRAVLNFDDFAEMAKNSIKPPPSADPALFPKPDATESVKNIREAGLEITKYSYDPNTYWQPLNFANNIELKSMATAYPGQSLGYLDGQRRQTEIRRQDITIAQYDLGNTSDEYDLRMAYKFNITDKEGLLSYNPALGTEQNMNCFEFTSIPFNHWFDIPSRMMANMGAVWIVNGGVYDFDYNGLPGVVPFIKKKGIIKAQPQVLSFKGEAGFAWNWGKNKIASIISRPKDIPATNLPAYMSTIFQDQTKNYSNVMGAMTFMTGKPGSGLYDIKALQPDWMKNYPPFPPFYLTADRCFFAPLSLNCGGTEVVAPIDDGWNDCAKLQTDNAVQRFSTLAYRQFPRTFDDIPNARTFIAIKENSLDIGIIDGDFGKNGYRGRISTKTLGMHVYEESQFALARGYDQFVNLDGGSSTQMWLNGRGPLQMMNSYVLTTDNQGPYYSRLLSSFIMLVPKLHTELIRQQPAIAKPAQIPAFNNTNINFKYDDKTDLTKDKAFIDLSVCKDSLNKKDGAYGMIAGNFTCSGNTDKNGGILFYAGEDMFYPETKGLYTVHPRLRNLMVVGIGMVLPSLKDSLMKLPIEDPSREHDFRRLIYLEDISAYYIKVYDGVITEYIFERDEHPKYLTGDHRFFIRSDGPSSSVPSGQNIFFNIDGNDVALTPGAFTYFSRQNTGFLNINVITHAYLGALNLDGRFLTGDINLKTYNYFFAVGKDAWSSIFNNTKDIDNALSKYTLPGFGGKYYQNGIFALQCMEAAGQHVFALSPQGTNRFYGLRLNNTLVTKNAPLIKTKTK